MTSQSSASLGSASNVKTVSSTSATMQAPLHHRVECEQAGETMPEVHRKYRVLFTMPAGKIIHAIVGDYLGRDQSTGELMFSQRPAAGTTHFNEHNIVSYEEVPATVDNHAPVAYREPNV